ncbi:MAG TPA: hypothetical protein ENH99_02920 [Candidatus Pacearchaeota archaeon]|nr:hypothetical protein [Candidatus Pacearchaeota archaeon]
MGELSKYTVLLNKLQEKQKERGERIEEGRKRERWKGTLKEYRSLRERRKDSPGGDPLPHAKKLLKDGGEVNEMASIAHYLTTSSDDPQHVLVGAQLYESLGKREKGLRRLGTYIEKVTSGDKINPFEKGQILDRVSPEFYVEVAKLIEREQGESGIETKTVGIFALFIAGGLILSLGSTTITGNAVSNVTGTPPGILGALLFIAGIVGMVFHFRGK